MTEFPTLQALLTGAFTDAIALRFGADLAQCGRCHLAVNQADTDRLCPDHATDMAKAAEYQAALDQIEHARCTGAALAAVLAGAKGANDGP